MIESSLETDPVVFTGRPFGRVARSVIGHGLLTGLMFISPLVVFIPATLYHCGIRNGRRAAWTALAIAILGSAVFFIGPGAKTSADQKLGLAYFVALIVAVGLPAMATFPLVERGVSFGRVLLTALVGSTLGLAATETGMRAFAGFSPYAEHMTRAREMSAQVIGIYRDAHAPADVIKLMEKWMGYALAVLPGSLIVYIALVFILSLVMLGRLRAWREHALANLGEDGNVYLFRRLSLPDWLLFVFLIGGLTPIVKGAAQIAAANVLMVVAFLYLIQGLAIFRAWVAGMPLTGLLFSYMALAFLTVFGVAPLMLSVGGLFDSFFDFRKLNRKDHSDESHSD